MVVLYSMLNVAGINLHVIYCANNPNVDLVRRKYLRKLAHELTHEHRQYRATIRNISPEVRKRRREAVGTPDETREHPLPGKRRRCEECKG
ncbi:unnamed protein product [Acanthoscelides obtectus]|uniref:Uncharacterized protein n=1 Tax=Acanthoscelides obtectus TaxID=200917 RepID=A0A9P0MB36_ACAOB|nr:unnamed protein product [Acanthoscelides obtectus]CAK1627114.1 hypothetical protein AOBTE_LOCUS4315 [Acanthoscelides obtectus]